MANRLKVAKVLSINQLHAQGWSQRRIARELGISRGAVSRHLQKSANEAKAPTGSADPNRAKAPTGSEKEVETSNRASEPCKAPTGSRSLCEPFREWILAKLEHGLSAQRIFQDLIDEHGFEGKYPSVRRYVARLTNSHPLPFRRIEVAPGEEAQIDFGQGAPLVDENGRRQRTHVIRVVLSHSRKAYSEAVLKQTADSLIQCLENAFLHFGGVPRTLVPDNLKAAVIRADWYDPDLNPKLQSFCRHYETVLLPTKPRTPRHKGKVERGVDYVQENALKGRTFASLQEQNEFLLKWETTVADTRIHGTTRKQVSKAFEEQERQSLGPLPRDRFPCFQEAQRKVCRDGHLTVAKSYYSVPPEYLGHTLWVRWDSRIVRIYNHQMDLICSHPAKPPGLFSTHREHIASEKISDVERGMDWLLDKIEFIGPKTHAWALGCVSHRGIEAARVLRGLLSLTGKHRSHQLEAACDIAHANQCYRLRSIRKLAERKESKQQQFEFLEQHPLIRNLSEYGSVVSVDLQKEAWKS
jgi:transposase